MSTLGVALHPPASALFLAPDFTKHVLPEHSPIEAALDAVLKARGRVVAAPERQSLLSVLKSAVQARTIAALRDVDESTWRTLELPAIFRVWMRHLLRQAVCLSAVEQLECDFNSGKALDASAYAQSVSLMHDMGFPQDMAMAALVVTGNSGVERAIEYTMLDESAQKREYEQAKRGRSKFVEPHLHHTVVAKRRALQSTNSSSAANPGGAASAPSDLAAPAGEDDGSFSEEDDECAICFESLSEGGMDVAELKCGHSFHRKCMTDWLAKNANSCPYCRAPLS